MWIYIAHTRSTSNALKHTNTGRRKMSWVSARMLTQCSQNPELGLEASSRQLVRRLQMLDGRMYYTVRRWRGTVSSQRLAERSRWRLAMSETGTQQSTRYCGALLYRHRSTVTPSLYQTRSPTSSQCKSACRICDSPRSYLRVPLTRHAAAFIARCSLSVTDLGELVSTMLQ